MPRIRRGITIDAPVEKVFDYISNPDNILEWWPNVTAVRDIDKSSELQSWTFDYKILGLLFTAKAKVTCSARNHVRRVESRGGVDFRWEWQFRREGACTQIRWELDYTIPLPALGKVGELLIVQRNNRLVRFAMNNIKERLET